MSFFNPLVFADKIFNAIDYSIDDFRVTDKTRWESFSIDGSTRFKRAVFLTDINHGGTYVSSLEVLVPESPDSVITYASTLDESTVGEVPADTLENIQTEHALLAIGG